MSPKAYNECVKERDALADAAARLLSQIDDGPRFCYGTEGAGRDVWKGSFHEHVEALRKLVALHIDDPSSDEFRSPDKLNT